MNPYQLPIAITALADVIARELSDDNLALASVVFTQLGDTLATISLRRSQCVSQRDKCSK